MSRLRTTFMGAEVMVGSMNFELLQPGEGPESVEGVYRSRGEGIASIAVMFDTIEESDAVKREFEKLGIGVTMQGEYGDHIEYYYLDTQDSSVA